MREGKISSVQSDDKHITAPQQLRGGSAVQSERPVSDAAGVGRFL